MKKEKGEMKKILLVILFPAAALMAFAFDSSTNGPVFRTESLSKNIHSVQIENYSRKPYYPIFELGGNEGVLLKFDDLSPDVTTYTYRIIHCNAHWQQDGLSESQYISGFTGGYLENYEMSRNTFQPYYHYELAFPNDDAQPTISGNYVIAVYASDNQETPVLTARFMVVEPHVEMKCGATSKTDIDAERTHQQVDINISYPQFNISQPSTDLKVVVWQNRRLDNMVEIDTPSFYEGRSVNYKLNHNLIFEAGNEFRTLDISSKYVLDKDVYRFEYFKPYYHVTLFPSEFRSRKQYESWQTANGRFIPNLQGSDYPDIEADYAFVHFTLPTDEPWLDGKVYILSEGTEYKFTDANQMHYNYETQEYEGLLFLKMGGYNYQYLYVPNGTSVGHTAPVEGDFWQTGNEYAVFTYFHPFGSLYDMLIGYWIGYFK